MKILVVQQKMIGDVLLSTVICEQLKKHLPKVEIHYVINEQTLAVVEHHPAIDKIILFTPKYKKSKLAFYQFLKSFSKEKYDAVIDVYCKLESNLISLFSHSKIKVSYHKWYSKFIYSHTFSYSSKTESTMGLAIENRLLLLQPILDTEITTVEPPKIFLTKAEKDSAKQYLKKNDIDLKKPLIMIGLLGSGPDKSYPLTYMAEVLDQIADESDATMLFNYIPKQIEEARALYALCKPATQAQIKFDVFAASLRDFLAVLYHSDALIGNEGGAINMAKALEVPTFSIFSPWINKEAWHTFRGTSDHIGIHIKDYLPEKLSGKSKKELKQITPRLYELFKPAFFKEDLQIFLKLKVGTH